MSTFRPTNNSFRYARAVCCLGLALVFSLGLMELGQEEVSGRRRLPSGDELKEYNPRMATFAKAPKKWKATFTSNGGIYSPSESNKENYIISILEHSKKIRNTGTKIAVGAACALFGPYGAIFGMAAAEGFQSTHLMKYTFRTTGTKENRIIVKLEKGSFEKSDTSIAYKFKADSTQYAYLESIEAKKINTQEKLSQNTVKFKLCRLGWGLKICNREVFYNQQIMNKSQLCDLRYPAYKQIYGKDTKGSKNGKKTNQLKELIDTLTAKTKFSCETIAYDNDVCWNIYGKMPQYKKAADYLNDLNTSK